MKSSAFLLSTENWPHLPAGKNFNLCVLIDGRLAGLKSGWPFSNAADYQPEIDLTWPGWQSFGIYEGQIEGRQFIGRPLCGTHRAAALGG